VNEPKPSGRLTLSGRESPGPTARSASNASRERRAIPENGAEAGHTGLKLFLLLVVIFEAAWVAALVYLASWLIAL